MKQEPGTARSSPEVVPAAAVIIGGICLYGLLLHVEGAVRLVLGNMLIVLAPAGAFAATFAAWRRSRDRAWLFLGGFCASWGAGQVLWAYYELIAHRLILFPSLADVGFLGGAAFAVGTVTVLPRRSAVPTIISALDGLIVALSLLIIGIAALGPTITARPAGQQWLGIVYPATDAAVLTAMLATLPSVAPRWRGQVLYVVAGFMAIAIADVGFTLLTFAGGYTTGSPIDLGWAAGFVFIALGARRARRSGSAPSDDADQRRRAAVILPHVAVIPAALAVLIVQLTRSTLDPIFIYLGIAVVPLAAVRHALTLLESERRAAALDREMTHDTLTSLWNRRTLSRALDELVLTDGTVTVVVLDIDDFTNVNDSAGPGAGDVVLREVASRLRSSISGTDLIARVGGDEFAAVFTGADRADEVVTRVTRLCDAFSAPFMVGSTVQKLTVSAGIARLEAGCDGSVLLRNADMAMHMAKRRGKNRFAHFDPALRSDVVERIELLADLEHAADRGELVLLYQPIHRIDGGSLAGVEALVRWQHPRRGLLRPDQFIPIAEATSHIETIGAWVLSEAAQFTARLMSDHAIGDDFYVAVNVAARQLYSDSFVVGLDRALGEAELPASAMVIELTESSLIDIDHALPILTAIRARGVRIAVDDFGTGYSSLSYLHQLPLDILKVDRSFVAHIDERTELRTMTRAIVSLGRSLGLVTVAEGVERTAQLDELRASGCTTAQGYLWSPPVSGDHLTGLIAQDRVRTAALA